MDDKKLRRWLFYRWFFRTMAAASSSAAGTGPLSDSDAELQRNRIVADGGTVTDTAFLNSLITDLKSGGCYSLLDALFVPIAIKKDGADKISKLYDLSLAKSGSVYYDAVQTTAALQQTWQDSQLDGKPAMLCDSARGGYSVACTTIGQPSTSFMICKQAPGAPVGSMEIISTGAGASGYYVDNNVFRCWAGANLSSSIITTTTWGQFTTNFNFGSSSMRRRNVDLVFGNPGSNSWSAYTIGGSGATTLNGNIAFAAVIRQSITVGQRNYIEGLLNTTYYPSTV